MNLLKIGNYVPPCPSDYTGTTSTAVDSGRNTMSVAIGSVVREDVAGVTATWNYLSVEEWAKILQQFSSKHGGSFYQWVTFFDQVTATKRKTRMYVGDRTTGGMAVLDINGKPKGWLNPKLELVEK